MRLFLVSSNLHKFQEIQKILKEYKIEILFYQYELPELQSDSLENIALFSAKHAYSLIQQPLFTEDTGFFIETLNGFPGPYASYIFKTIGNQGILDLLEKKSNRKAIFRTVIAVVLSNTKFITFLGEAKGTIALVEKGDKGWGYDPIFIPLEGDKRSYGEMHIDEKNKLSHRRKALILMSEYLNKHFPNYEKRI
ncbi:MAG: XTP/dITP diphosphatase [Promethearchaeota archaeon]